MRNRSSTSNNIRTGNLRGGDTSSSSTTTNKNNTSSFVSLLKYYYVELTHHELYDTLFVCMLLLFELLLSLLIVRYVKYTEIDWIAYMEEVDTWWYGSNNDGKGEYDYMNIRGGTGPLVYPAGFLYLYKFIQVVTGRDIQKAQYLFVLLYVTTQFIVFMLYTQVIQYYRQRRSTIASSTTSSTTTTTATTTASTIWSLRICMICLCLSKRYHSIFLLRLFNDGPTMLVTYLSFWCFINHQWKLGCFVYSVAVSLKMNVLLFAPGLLYLLLQITNNDIINTMFPYLFICGITQLIIGYPFLSRYPISYLRKAFELDRVFFYKWTVNWKFLSEQWFLSKYWSIFLLTLHVGLLCLYYFQLYSNSNNKRHQRQQQQQHDKKQQELVEKSMTPDHILSTLFVSNFIGICCARTIHYQFYSWYVSSLPFLLWYQQSQTQQASPSSSSFSYYSCYPLPIRILLLICCEYAYLVFPATATSSMILQVAHWSILLPHFYFLYKQQPTSTTPVSVSSDDDTNIKKKD